MSAPASNVVKVDWDQVVPWRVLFRALGLAFHVRQVLVGTIAAGLIAVAYWYFFDRAMPYASLNSNWNLGRLFEAWPIAPLADLVFPIELARSFSGDDGTLGFHSTLTWSGFGRCMLLVAWTLLVGTLAGGILARRAALEYAQEESVSLRDAMRFVFKRTIDYLSAPLLPLLVVLAIGFCGLLTGWLAAAVPYVSSGLAAIWLLPLALGVLMAGVLLLVIVAWPLMVAAVSVNAGDGFDSLSRGFGMVLDRWRYYAWCAFLLVVYGNVGMMIGLTLIEWGNALASRSIELGLGSQPHPALDLASTESSLTWCLKLILTGFAYSYFWSGMTLTYLLLRKSLDNAQLQDVFLDKDPNESNGLAELRERNPIPDTSSLLPIITLPSGN